MFQIKPKIKQQAKKQIQKLTNINQTRKAI